MASGSPGRGTAEGRHTEGAVGFKPYASADTSSAFDGSRLRGDAHATMGSSPSEGRGVLRFLVGLFLCLLALALILVGKAVVLDGAQLTVDSVIQTIAASFGL